MLEIAAEHLRHRGPNRLTVVAIAAEAGIATTSVYHYFPSKESLLDAVVGHWLRNVEAELAQIAHALGPADDKLERLLTTLARVQRETLAREPNLFAVHVDATVKARPPTRRHRVRLRSLVECMVADGIAADAFMTRNRERAIAYIFDASYRFTHPLAIQQDADLPHDLVEARFATVILAIQTVLRTGTI